MLNRALLAAVSLVTLAACEAEATKPSGPATPTPTPTNAQQTWLCGREYVNHAWGYQRRGLVLDMSGNIWKYDIKSSPAAMVNPWQPTDMAHMTEAELKMRYNGAMVVSGKHVPGPEIEKVFPLIDDASRAKLTEPEARGAETGQKTRSPRGADMGQTVLYCLKYDARSRTYGEVTLDNNGDMDSTNPSQAARNLRSWLNGWFKDIN
jgi:hypothetical protein